MGLPQAGPAAWRAQWLGKMGCGCPEMAGSLMVYRLYWIAASHPYISGSALAVGLDCG